MLSTGQTSVRTRARPPVRTRSARIIGTAVLPQAVIAATGLFTPPHSISNTELVEAAGGRVSLDNKGGALRVPGDRSQKLRRENTAKGYITLNEKVHARLIELAGQ